MEVIKEIENMQKIAHQWHKKDLIIGFVPTMGYLHEGHLSLVRLAREKANKVVVSIFVNPLQFGPSEDYHVYPRDPKRDLDLLEKEKVDVVFMPDAEKMYPQNFQTFVEVSNLTKGLCGTYRPNHFRGVTTVVLKLFNIIKPHFAVFGEKDYQQLKVIQQMVRDLNLELDIISHPIVRERDGLAMSSRNIYLTEEERRSALSLYQALKLAERLIIGGERDVSKIKKLIQDYIEKFPYTKVQYVEIVDPETLEGVKEIKNNILIALAVYVGKTRLIDNKLVKLDSSV